MPQSRVQPIKELSLHNTWAMVFLAALALYATTANRGVQWQDSGWQQWRIVTGQWEHPLGLALVHPLQYCLGRAAIRLTFLEPAFATTLLSSLAGAVAIANIVGTLVILTRRLGPALIAGAALMLAHTFWQHATHTESYAIVAALLSAEWFCLARYATTCKGRYLLGLALCNGLGLANHLLAGLTTPVNVVVILWAIRQKHLSVRGGLAAIGLWLAGTLPYTVLVAYTFMQTSDFGGTLRSAMFGIYSEQVLNVRPALRSLFLAGGFVLYNFPGLILPLAAYAALVRLSVPRVFTRAIKIQLLIYLIFVVRYSISDQYTFFFPVYMLLALLAGLGLDRLATLWPPVRRRAVFALAGLTVLWTPFVYMTACCVLESRGVFKAMVGNKPYRNGYQAFLIPWGVGQTYAADLNRQVARLAGEDGLVLVADNMIRFGLLYGQALGRFGDAVEIVLIQDKEDQTRIDELHERIQDCLAHDRPVVLVPQDRDHPYAPGIQGQWSRREDVYLLTDWFPPAGLSTREASP
ncbi:MAG: DUF2723 domain-containing protein [Phycisphaerales bacterium]|nr:DUF2723 domain-containing protein [Phycisphaerales bacterium]